MSKLAKNGAIAEKKAKYQMDPGKKKSSQKLTPKFPKSYI